MYFLPPDLEPFRSVDEKTVSAITGRPLKSLQNDRWAGKGIPFYKLSPGRRGSVRYRLSDVLDAMASARVETRR